MYPPSDPYSQTNIQHNTQNEISKLLQGKKDDLWANVVSIISDLKERINLEAIILKYIDQSLLRIDNEELSGNQEAWKDRSLFEIERIKEYREAFKDIQRLKHLLREQTFVYQEAKRQEYFSRTIIPNEKIISALRPVLKENADLLYLAHTIKAEEQILLPTPQPSEVQGLITLGNILDEGREIYPCKLQWPAINKHILIVGETGAGKTNLINHLLKQIMPHFPCLIFDFKRDYRFLAGNSIVIRWDDLNFNPLQEPAGVSRLQWMQAFADVFSQDNSLLLGAKGFLIEHLDYLFKHFKDTTPNLKHLHHLLKTIKIHQGRREASYLSVCKNRLNTLSIECNNIVDANGTIEDLLSKNVIIELDGLGIESQNFLINIILTWIYLYRMAKGERGKLKHLVVFDEAKRIFDINKEKRPIEGIPNIDILTSRIREFGEGLIVADQEWSKLTDSIKANSFIKIIFRMGFGKDVEDAARSISLSRKDYIGRLETGQAIVKLGNLHPFLVKIPVADIVKNTKADSGVKSRFEPIRQPILPIRVSDKLTREETNFLEDVAHYPLSLLTERYRRLNLTADKGNRIKKQLFEQELVKEIAIVDKRKIILLDITPKAAILIGINPKKGWRKGGVEHQYWCHKIADYYWRKGFTVELEVPIGEGKAVDLVAKKDGKRIAIEIETGKSDVEKNIEQCLKAGFDEIIVVATNKEVKTKIKEKAVLLGEKLRIISVDEIF